MPGNPLSDELLGEIQRGCEAATPGPWKHGHWAGQCNKPEHRGNHPGLKGDNPCVYDYAIYEGGNGIASAQPRIEVIGSDYDGVAAKETDLAHIARLDPQTVSALVTELIDARALIALIREEAAKDNAPLGRSDSLALARIRSLTPNKDTTS